MTLIQVKRGTAAQWTTVNPVLSPGEFGFETDTHKIKVGTGFAYWNDLGYVPLSAADIGLDNVDNTADLDKPISTATQTALDGKADTVHGHVISDVTGLDTALDGKADATHSHVTSDVTGLDGALSDIDTALSGKADSVHAHTTADVTGLDTTLSGIDTALDGKSDVGHTHAQSDITGLTTALDGKEPSLVAGTTGDYYRGDKTWQTLNKTAVGLSDVDNTSDATKNAAAATLTNKVISGADNTLSSIPQSAITDLTDDLAAKEDSANKGQAGGYASLDGGGKVPVSQLPNSIMTYNGLWNASTNSPALADGTGDSGDVYRVSTGGSQDFGSGAIGFVAGDYVIYNGSVWEKADTTDAISSINGYTGNVTLTKSDLGLGDVDNTADATKNVLSATKLTTSRDINGVAFDGTANITVADDTKVPTTRTVNSKALSADVVLTQDDIASGTTNKAYTATEQTKLAGIASAATANSSDATLLDRANHTGTQTASTISDFSTAADARVSAAVGVSVQAYSANLTTWASETAPTGAPVGDTDTQTLSNKTLTNPTINGYTEGVLAAGTVTSSYTLSLAEDSVITATLTASTACTFTMPTAVAGKSFTLMLKQAASTGNGTATFTGVKWGTSGAPTITAAAGKMDILTFFSDGVNWYGSAAQGYTP